MSRGAIIIAERARAVALIVVLLLASTKESYAEESQELYEFDITQETLGGALTALSKQARVPLLYPYDLADRAGVHPVVGRFTVSQALSEMLRDTDFSGGLTESGVVTVSLTTANGQSQENEVSKGKFKKSLLASVSGFLFGAGGAALVPAYAQSEADDVQDTVVVTGSRIANANLTSSSSVTVLEAGEFDARGVIRVEDLINTLPQALSGQSSFSGIGAGTATVNLRGLGANRTLVLVDGKRLPFGSPINVAADLNQVPAQLVERIEVLTGGASAVYGADAVAGVVNFKMKRDFQGIEANLQGSFFHAGNNNSEIEAVLADFNQADADSIIDGRTLDFSVVAGGDLDSGRGNITAYFGYSNDNPVRWEDRDISSCPFGTRSSGTEFSCQGSGAMPFPTRFTDSGLTSGFNLTVDQETGVLRNFDGARDTFDFSEGNFLQRPRERITLGARVHYDLRDNVEWFMNYSFADNTTDAQIAPSGLATGRTDSINCDNPLLSAEQLAVFCDPAFTFVDSTGVERGPLFIGRRNVEGGPRNAQFSLATHRVEGGFRGEAFEGFDYEVFGQYSNVDFSEVLTNDVITSRVALALDVVTDPATGEPVCRSALSGDEPDCVPWDIFSVNGVTQEAAAFITTPSLRDGKTTQLVFGGNLAGDLGRFGMTSPLAQEPIQLVAGFEFRRDFLELTPDSSEGLTNLREPVSGAVEVYEFFGEAQVPLIEDRPMFDELTLNGAYRFSDFYKTTGTQSTYSAGLSWAPISDLRFRGQYQRATRSPNPIELFSPQSNGGFILSAGVNGLRDPCAGDFDAGTSTPEPARSFEECARTGVTAAQYGSIVDSTTGEFDTLAGGNPDLEPEVSDTWTAGVILSPRMIPGLTVSVDYFNIDVQGFIGTVPPEFALTSCLDSSDPFFCGLINRDTAGTLWLIEGEAFIQATNINTGKLKTSGIDVNANYVFELDDLGIANGGQMRVGYISTFLNELEEQSLPGAAPFDCAGFYGGVCQTPKPEYRHRATLGWARGKIDTMLTWRYIGSVRQFGTTTSPINETLDATSYFDLSMRYAFSDALELRAGVSNVLDQDPPLTSIAGFGGNESAGRANTFPQIYDAQGRYVFAGVTARF